MDRQAARRVIALGVALACLAACLALAAAHERQSYESLLAYCEGAPVRFLTQDAFIEEGATIAIEADPLFGDVEIYYTLDGGTPDRHSARYSAPFALPCEGAPACVPVKAALYYRGQRSDVFCKTYFVGEPEANGAGLTIISISIDPDELYDEADGLFAADNLRKRGDEWTRPAYVEIFEADGTQSSGQWAGLEVYGQASAAHSPRSLQIKADRMHPGGLNRFEYSFRTGQADSRLSHVIEVKNLTLHAGGQDRVELGSMLRAAVASRLSEASGFTGGSRADRAVVYLNGQLYSLVTVQPSFSDSTLRGQYGLPESAFIKYKGGMRHGAETLGYKGAIEADLTQPERREALEALVDMDSYLHCHALELLLDNAAFADQGAASWRYTGLPVSGNVYSDGRVRFMLSDVDGIYADAAASCFDAAMLGDFASVMRAEPYRFKFATYVCDMLGGAFSRENLRLVIEQEAARVEPAIAGLCEAVSGGDADAWRLSVDALLDRALAREASLLDDIRRHLSLDETYVLRVRPGDAVVAWNHMEIAGAPYEARYFAGCPFTIAARPAPGYAVKGFTVNGKWVPGDTLELSAALIQDGAIDVSVACELLSEALVISELYAASGEDWIELLNAGTDALDLSEYTLSDDPLWKNKYSLEGVTLDAGEALTVYCKNNYFMLFERICNFNISQYETIALYKNGMMVDSVVCPVMRRGESYGRVGAVWRFFANPTRGEVKTASE